MQTLFSFYLLLICFYFIIPNEPVKTGTIFKTGQISVISFGFKAKGSHGEQE